MSTPNPVLVQVSPEILAVLQALEAFDNAIGPDPAKWALNFPPAKLTLDGAVLKQLQLVAPALGGLAVTEVNGLWANLASKVTAATTPA
jgi:hypothetical protein